MRRALFSLLKILGKGQTKVAAVFGFVPPDCRSAVLHLHSGAPGVPVWLFSTAPVDEETRSLCERVEVHPSSLVLFFRAQTLLWPHWVALAIAPWTGQHGHWPLKWAPFLIPPFRALLSNEHGDFLPGTPRYILRHTGRRVRDALHSGGNRVLDLIRAYWHWISFHHFWRAARVRRVRDQVAALSLFVFATVLRLLGSPHRILFRHLHGREPLTIETPPPGETGVLRVSQWISRKFPELVQTSSARFVLWEEDPAAADWMDRARALFDDPRTFAVSRQCHFRAWKRLLFPTAPFRTLQAGEASQVLAPISSGILFDRQKLLALGIPLCGLAGSAWLILFWKAASAGWRSYSLGEGSALEEQPDYPMQEAGFFAHFLSNPPLRRLGPREPDLSRGSIAFAPGATAPRQSDRLRVLLVSPFLPYPLSHGGAVRIYNLCRELAGRVDFVLAAIREKHDVVDYARLGEIFRAVYVVDKDERPAPDDLLPDQVRQHQSRSLRALVAELSRVWKPDLLQVEYTHMADVRDAAPEIPAVLVEHDLTFSLYRQLAEKSPGDRAAAREYQRWLEFERRWLGVYDLVWTVADEDRDAAIRESGRPAGRTVTIANGVDIQRFTPSREPPASSEIFYVGSFRHLPNIIGYEKLRDEVMPVLWKTLPEVRLRVVAGPQHLEFWRRFAPKSAAQPLDSRIEIHGFVEDLRPLYSKASVVVVPLEVSAGTNIKVMEAMACGKAVVTTPIGCAGLGLQDREDAFIEANWAGFAKAAIELLSDEPLRARVGSAARRTVEERFSWTAIAQQAYESYLAALSVARTLS